MPTTSEPVAAPVEQPAGPPSDIDVEDPWASWADDEPVDEAALAAEQERLEARLVRHDVTAILVAHDGARWLRFSLAALADLDRAPRRVVAVDTGSTDATAGLLADSLGAASVLPMPRETGYGAAIAHAVTALTGALGLPSPGPDLPVVEWLWLLHDDCAPEPDALHELLLEAERTPSAAVIGPKVRGWKDGRLLLEMGVTVGRGGRRETGLERGETDQGQHDHRHDVLAVGSAGLLVRRDVWDELGGFAPDLPLFADDVDFGWRARRAGRRVVVAPAAVVHHAEATAHGRRPAEAAGGDTHRAERRSALLLLLGNLPARSLPWAYLRLTVGSLLRALALLIGKAPVEAAEEIGAWASVVLRPDRVRAARRLRAATRTEPWSSVKAYLAPTGTHLRRGLEALAGMAGGQGGTGGGALESGPVSEDAEDMASGGDGVLVRLLRRPGSWVGLGLTALTVLAWRGLLFGGALQGGALLPAPAGSSDLWQRYSEAWHEVGVGSAAATPPWVAAIALPSVLTLGRPGLLVWLLFVLAVPLAGVSAYLLLRRLSASRTLRMWGSVTYPLLPAVSGAVAAGRLGTVLVAWLLPLLALAARRAVPPRVPSWRAVAGLGLFVSLAAAFVPVVWLAAALAAAVGGAVVRPPRGWWLRVVMLLLVPVAVLLPWSWTLVTHPATVLLEAGAAGPGLADSDLPSWAVLLASPGGPGVPARWITVGLLLGGLAALALVSGRRAVATAWGVAMLGLLLGLLTLVVRVWSPPVDADVTPWPGVATLLLGGGLVAASVLAAEGSRTALSGSTFGWRQPLTATLVVLAAAVPVLAGVSWLHRGAGGPLSRQDGDVLPAFVAAAAVSPERPSTLVLSSTSDATVSYALLHDTGVQLGDSDAAPAAAAAGPLDDLVQILASGSASDDAVARLTTYGAGYVLVLNPADPDLVDSLNSTPGLERLSTTGGSALWRVAGEPSQLRVQASDGSTTALPWGSPGTNGTQASLPPADDSSPRILALASAADASWRASVDGTALSPVPAGVPAAVDPPVPAYAGPSATWAQRFQLSTSGGELVVDYDGTARSRWLLAQGVLLLIVVVVALPGRRREQAEDDDEPDLIAPASEPLHKEGAPT